jgi:hypothetical protein
MKITLDYMSEESMRKHGEEHDRLNLLGYGVVKREKISKWVVELTYSTNKL